MRTVVLMVRTSPGGALLYPCPQWERLFGQEEMKVCILGLDNAGKTTVLYKITMGEVISTAPTVSLESLSRRLTSTARED